MMYNFSVLHQGYSTDLLLLYKNLFWYETVRGVGCFRFVFLRLYPVLCKLIFFTISSMYDGASLFKILYN